MIGKIHEQLREFLQANDVAYGVIAGCFCGRMRESERGPGQFIDFIGFITFIDADGGRGRDAATAGHGADLRGARRPDGN
jgi:hypothetical protein